MSWIRLKFTVSVGLYQSGSMYDVEDSEASRALIEGGYATLVPYPTRTTEAASE